MKEYIDKEKAIQILTDSSDAYGTFSVERSIYLTARQKVKNIPAADVAPVVHGKWIHPYHKAFDCSICQSRISGFVNMVWSYCPNCGARMIGGNENG